MKNFILKIKFTILHSILTLLLFTMFKYSKSQSKDIKSKLNEKIDYILNDYQSLICADPYNIEYPVDMMKFKISISNILNLNPILKNKERIITPYNTIKINNLIMTTIYTMLLTVYASKLNFFKYNNILMEYNIKDLEILYNETSNTFSIYNITIDIPHISLVDNFYKINKALENDIKTKGKFYDIFLVNYTKTRINSFLRNNYKYYKDFLTILNNTFINLQVLNSSDIKYDCINTSISSFKPNNEGINVYNNIFELRILSESKDYINVKAIIDKIIFKGKNKNDVFKYIKFNSTRPIFNIDLIVNKFNRKFIESFRVEKNKYYKNKVKF